MLNVPEKKTGLKTILNIQPEFDTKHELFKISVDEISSCEQAIKSDKPNLCVCPSPSSVIFPALISPNPIH